MAIRGFLDTDGNVTGRRGEETTNAFRNLATASNDPVMIAYRRTKDREIKLEQAASLAWRREREALQYFAPSFSNDDRLFFDLVSYAPGMSTSRADVLAILEAETASFDKPGRIDAAARRLFDKARPSGWQALQLPADGDNPALTITFNGTGRYCYERTLPPGIRERVVCDGKTLWHLYPGLHVGARRSVSRFHRLDFARLVPWSPPHIDDLARGADVKLVGERIVAVVPHGAGEAKDRDAKPLPYAVLHFVFDEGGRLAEQRVVEMPAKKVLARVLLGADGTLRVLGAKDRELAALKSKLSPAAAPNLTPDLKKLVVLSLPYRSRDHVLKVRKLEGKGHGDMPFEDALELFASAFGAGNGEEALKVFREGFHARDHRPLGFYVLLAACGQNLDSQNADVLSEYPDEPLAQYLALHSSPVLRQHASQWAAGSGS